MRLRFTRRSLRHLDEIRAYIGADDPAAANRVIARLREAIDGLIAHPQRGRPGRVPDTRELIVAGLPSIMPYRVRGETIDGLAVIHGARAWPGSGL